MAVKFCCKLLIFNALSKVKHNKFTIFLSSACRKNGIEAPLYLCINCNMDDAYKLVGSKHNWENRDSQLKLLIRFGLKADHDLLDFGCGILRGGINIINYLDDGKYHGYDVSRKRLDVGKSIYEKSGINKKIYLSDQMPNYKKFDVIWAFQVFIHIADNIFDENLKLLLAHLSGYAYISTYSAANRKGQSWMEFPHVLHDQSFYKAKFEPYNGTIVRETPAPKVGGVSHIWRINHDKS